jgi:hypothetical protein
MALNRQDLARIAARYIRFAEEEAHGRSPLYEQLARGIAEDRETLEFLLALPLEKRQPNLVLAAVRHLFETPADWTEFRQMLVGHLDAVRTVILERSTQTNEPARCATLLPLLMRLPQPLALLEVGASAGLCLLPDLYAYEFGKGLLAKSANLHPPIFSCKVNEATPLPAEVPNIAWRAGLDLNPLDVSDRAQAGWLETLVWPGQTDRLARLRAAIEIASRCKPRIVKGDLRYDLAALAGEAPKDATLVIYHTAVLAYVTLAADRQNFAKEVRALCPYWICNESPAVFPEVAEQTGIPGPRGSFLLSVNGEPVAWTDPHGASLEWVGHSATFSRQ